LRQTYPFASALCVKAEAGSLGKRLEPSRDQVRSACRTLEQPFAGLEATVTSAEAQYSQTVANEAALVVAACPQPVTRLSVRLVAPHVEPTHRGHDRVACAPQRGGRVRHRGAPVRRRASIDAHGARADRRGARACREVLADAVLLGAVGGPEVGHDRSRQAAPEQGLLGLRKGLGLFANLRPVRALPALYDASPLREERIAGTDLLVVRELTGGIYFGEKTRTATSRLGPVRRVQRRGDRADRARRLRCGAAAVTSVDKANVLETSRLWREVVSACTQRSSRRSSSSTCSSTTRQCSSSARPAAST
jgi:hypothetical protein